MSLVLRYRDQVRSQAGSAVVQELESLVASLSALLNAEHDREGAHGEVTATSVTMNGATLLGYTSSDDDPTILDLPGDHTWGLHKNVTSGDVFLAYNDNGTILKVQLT